MVVFLVLVLFVCLTYWFELVVYLFRLLCVIFYFWFLFGDLLMLICCLLVVLFVAFCVDWFVVFAGVCWLFVFVGG